MKRLQEMENFCTFAATLCFVLLETALLASDRMKFDAELLGKQLLMLTLGRDCAFPHFLR